MKNDSYGNPIYIDNIFKVKEIVFLGAKKGVVTHLSNKHIYTSAGRKKHPKKHTVKAINVLWDDGTKDCYTPRASKTLDSYKKKCLRLADKHGVKPLYAEHIITAQWRELMGEDTDLWYEEDTVCIKTLSSFPTPWGSEEEGERGENFDEVVVRFNNDIPTNWEHLYLAIGYLKNQKPQKKNVISNYWEELGKKIEAQKEPV